MITIETELLRDLEAAQTRSREAMDILLAQGVSVTAFMTSGWPGVDRIVTVERLWRPDPDGQDMIILPVWLGPGPLCDDDPILVDLIAFQVEQPDRWHYRDGKPGLVLGDDQLDDAIGHMCPIWLHENPIDWLRAGCQGAVVLEDAEHRHDRERIYAHTRANGGYRRTLQTLHGGRTAYSEQPVTSVTRGLETHARETKSPRKTDL
jgi:hypothetical protein